MVTFQTSGRATLQPLMPVRLPDLERAAAADAHRVIAATHLVEKHGEIVGYASVGSVMVLNTWVARGKVTARESFTLLRECEAKLQAMGAEYICLPVSVDSPFRPLVAGLGYTHLGESGYNLKFVKSV